MVAHLLTHAGESADILAAHVGVGLGASDEAVVLGDGDVVVEPAPDLQGAGQRSSNLYWSPVDKSLPSQLSLRHCW